MHQTMKVGDKTTVFSIIDFSQFEVKVIVVDKERDYILLECADKELCSITFSLAAPYEGEEYIQLGLSALSQNESPFSVSRGVFTSTRYSKKGHFLGSAGANPGESGGGCFADECNILYGINLGCDSINISNDTTLFELGARHPARSHILPSIYFV